MTFSRAEGRARQFSISKRKPAPSNFFEGRGDRRNNAAANGNLHWRYVDLCLYDASGLFEALKSEVRYYNFAGTPVVTRTTYTYDASHHVTDIHTTNAAGSTVARFQYTYDAAGRVLTQDDNSVVTTYAYDNANQLTGEDFASGTDGAYSYDLGGNRTMSGYATGDDNRVTANGVYTFTYDDEGNLEEKTKVGTSEKWTYTYDHGNRLTGVTRTTNGTTIDLRATYTYDANGNRVQSSVDADGDGAGGAVVTKYLLDGWNPAKGGSVGAENVDVFADLKIDNTLKVRYLRGDTVDQLLARIEVDGDHAGTYWYLTDKLGSIRKVLDNGAAVKDAIGYDAYGNILAGETDSSYRGRYAWTGREIEVEAKLQFNRARFYDPSIGRWISKDPVGFSAGDSNLYRYVNNAPTNYGDPSGLTTIESVVIRPKGVGLDNVKLGVIVGDDTIAYGFDAKVTVDGKIKDATITQEIYLLFYAAPKPGKVGFGFVTDKGFGPGRPILGGGQIPNRIKEFDERGDYDQPFPYEMDAGINKNLFAEDINTIKCPFPRSDRTFGCDFAELASERRSGHYTGNLAKRSSRLKGLLAMDTSLPALLNFSRTPPLPRSSLVP
jgi:RHS repeat-associated protein